VKKEEEGGPASAKEDEGDKIEGGSPTIIDEE
jgi:hypothetical protein